MVETLQRTNTPCGLTAFPSQPLTIGIFIATVSQALLKSRYHITRVYGVSHSCDVYLCEAAEYSQILNMESQIEEWKQRAEKFTVKDLKALSSPFTELDAHLTLRSFIAGHSQTDADIAVYQAIRSNHIASSFLRQGLLVNGLYKPLSSDNNITNKCSLTLGKVHRRHKSFPVAAERCSSQWREEKR